MKKDVLVAISSTQQFEGCPEEQIDLVTCASLYQRQGKYYISYEESELTGLDGTRTTIKIDAAQKAVTMIRAGTYPSNMQFVEGQRQVGLYQTDYGAMTVATRASRVASTIGEYGGALVIDYIIEVDNAVTGTHHFEIIVSQKEEKD